MIKSISIDQISTEPLSIENALHLWIRNGSRNVCIFLHFYHDSVKLFFRTRRTGVFLDRVISREKGIAIAAKTIECGMIVEVLQ
jgi:hypothetical protein